MTGRQLSMIKAITVMELLDEPLAMKSYLNHCEKHRDQFWYSRHLQMVELHVHLLYPDLWQSLDEHVRIFLQEVRKAAENSKKEGAKSPKADLDDGSDLDDEGDSDDEDSDSDSETTIQRPPGKGFDHKHFSSAMHEDISRILIGELGVQHSNQLAAGPLTLDICHVPTMTVIEAAASWQYYLRSAQTTALARRRQEILKAMDFKLLIVPYHRWEVLEDDVAKAAYLRQHLPSEVLSNAGDDKRSTGSVHGNVASPPT
eukprot:TRINITY_DN65680_c0_g1_i1.p1 TRINITY_DN65680_c0_g1~~TRINITY_DN65680_c0_g1_i1.p1  ORF type:complete len:287 (+),score=63.76 TRINITY_DN65680_c0_g1_i1:90-863(+)